MNGRAKASLFPPHICDSEEAAEQVYSLDLAGLSRAGLIRARHQTERILARDPGAWVWLGAFEHVTVGEWATERLRLIEGFLETKAPGRKPAPIRPRAKRRGTPWIR